MKKIQSYLVALFLLFPIIVTATSTVDVLKTGQTTMYVTGDDGDIEAGKAWVTPRFTDNGDGTVSDNETGLMWMKNAKQSQSSKVSWEDAFTVIDNLNTSAYASYNDWTMPNILELESLTDVSRPYWNPIVAPHPFTNYGYYHWSSTTTAWVSGAAYVFSSANGMTDTTAKTSTTKGYVWIVRVEDTANLTIPKTGQKTSYCTGDDGDLERGFSLTRFVDHGDGTVTDRVTGLLWLKDISCLGRQTWTNSFTRITSLNGGALNCTDYTATHNDWRLPNKNELRSVIDYNETSWSGSDIALTNGHPFVYGNLDNKAFWSSNTYSGDNFYQNTAWDYYMNGGYSERHRAKNGDYLNVWAVRGGEVN